MLEYNLCPAKINLGLKILYKRDDGLHELNSIFIKINWGDEIFIEKVPNKEFQLFSENLILGKTKSLYDSVSCPESIDCNLLHKAFYQFDHYKNLNFGVKVYLKKKIPLGSGLGGSSSNAAFLLSYLSKHNNYPSIGNLGSQLGCDVPFFLQKENAFVHGVGDIIKPLNIAKGIGLLAFPDIHLQTKQMYESLKKPLQKQSDFNQCNFLDDSILDATKSGDWKSLRGNLFNDFEKVAFSKFPMLQDIKKKFYDLGASYSSMSGSGSSIFSLLENKESDKLEFIKKKMESCFPSLFFVRFSF